MNILRAAIRGSNEVVAVYVRAWKLLTRRRPKTVIAPEALLDPTEFLRAFNGFIASGAVADAGDPGKVLFVDPYFSGSSGLPVRRHHWQNAAVKSSDV
jgi:hypothetical protein